MKINQIYTILNETAKEVLGETGLINEDLSNIVDLGEKVLSNKDWTKVFAEALPDHIGRVVIADSLYEADDLGLLRDSWEYGSILEKITIALPETAENQTWELEDGAVYEENRYTATKVSVKFFNQMVTFEVPYSILDRQFKMMFSSADQANSILTGIYMHVKTRNTVELEKLTKRLINTMIAESIKAAYDTPTNVTGASKKKVVVNLLDLFNKSLDEANQITAAEALSGRNKEFNRFAAYTISEVSDQMETLTTLFNIGGLPKFTKKKNQHILVLSSFSRAIEFYLESDVYHNDMVKLPKFRRIQYWQAPGTNFDINDTSAIDVKTSDGTVVKLKGIVATIFDHNTVAICNEDHRAPSKHIDRAEFTNVWDKTDIRYLADTDEPFVAFIIA